MADFKQITVGGVSHPVKDEVARQGLAGKQDKLTFDDTPTANSNNPVKSGGVYQAIQSIDVSSQISGKEDKSNKVTSFSSPTDTQYPSAKLVSDQLATKQGTISDLSTIRSGASAGATAYQKPGTGIPSTDLASAVQTSLGKADTAIQSVTVGTTTTGAAGSSASVSNTGTATAPVLSFTIPQGAQGIQGIQGPQGERGPQGNTGVQVDSVASIIHSIDPTATYAAADVAGADAVQDVLSEVTELSEEVGEIENKVDVIDDEPTAGSDNLVKSGGVKEEIESISRNLSFDTTDNLLDDSFLKRDGILQDWHTFSGKISSFNRAEIPYSLNKRSTFSFSAKVDQSSSPSGIGLYFHITFADGTYNNVNVPLTTSEYTTFSYILRKEVTGISVSYSTGGNNIIFIKDLQIREGDNVLPFIPYFSPIDYNARKNIVKEILELKETVSKKTDGTIVNFYKVPIVTVGVTSYGVFSYTIKFLSGTTGDIFSEKGKKIATITNISDDTTFTLNYPNRLLYNPTTNQLYTINNSNTEDIDGILLLAIEGTGKGYYTGPLSPYIDNSFYSEKRISDVKERGINDVINSITIGSSYSNEYGFGVINPSNLARASSLPFHLNDKFIYIKCPGFRVSLQATNMNGTGHEGITAVLNAALFPCNYMYGSLLFFMADGSSNFTESDITYLKNVLEISLISIPKGEYIGDEVQIGRKCRNFIVENFLTLDTQNAHCQGCAIYGNYLFMLEDSDVYTFWIFDMTTGNRVGTVTAPVSAHYNNIIFGNTFPDGNTQFPYLYIDEWGGTRKIHVLEVNLSDNVFSMSLVQSISFANVDNQILGAGQLDFAIDFTDNILYTVAHDDSANMDRTDTETMICSFNLPTVSSGETVLGDTDVISHFIVPNIPTRQCLQCYDGKIYILHGYSNFKIAILNVKMQMITTSIDFRGLLSGYEAEAFALYNGHFLLIRANTAEIKEVIF